MKDGYYECVICTRAFKIVDGKKTQLNLRKDIDEILANNVTISNCEKGKHISLRNTVKLSQKSRQKDQLLQDYSRFSSYLRKR